MAIGRAEDRDTPWDPVMFNIARMFRSPIRVTHLGQRSDRPHTQAGHMTAIDQTCFSCIKSLHARGPFFNRAAFGKSKFLSSAWGAVSPSRLRIEVRRAQGRSRLAAGHRRRRRGLDGREHGATLDQTGIYATSCRVMVLSAVCPVVGQPQPGIGEAGTAMSETRSTFVRSVATPAARLPSLVPAGTRFRLC